MISPLAVNAPTEPIVLVTTVAMVGCFALALWLRSWVWWLAGYVAAVGSLVLLWGGR